MWPNLQETAQICRSHLLKKSLMEDFIFCEVVIFFEIKDSLEIKNDFWLQSLPKNRL